MLPGTTSTKDEEDALSTLGQLISDCLMRDPAVVDCGSHLTCDGGAQAFAEKVISALRNAMADFPKEKLQAILMEKIREERRLDDLPVLIDDDLPDGFRSN